MNRNTVHIYVAQILLIYIIFYLYYATSIANANLEMSHKIL